ncbi:hypothetical protein [Pelagovum pacificum]|uniref:hypothetical protein n=1 Tax=Pelagovum pacificum TaxID=2588711 RepID=UPI001E38AB56|nr:hypothetical protein [Pelagovum pacificum]
MPALILRAETAVTMGDFDTAYTAATSAWRNADVPVAKFASARLAALAMAGQQRHTWAQFWLRRARQTAPDDLTRQMIAEDYEYVRRQNPLSFTLDFNASPTDNVNNGSEKDTLTLPGLPFVFALTGDARALPGTEYSAGLALRYRIRETPRSVTWLESTVFGRTYTLSDDALDIKPDAKGADYAETQLSFGIGHLWSPDGGPDPWRFSASFGRFWYAGEPWSDFRRVQVSRGVTLSDSDALDFGLTLEHHVNAEVADSDAYGLTAEWRHRFDDVGTLTLGAGGRRVDADGFDRAYDAVSVEASWQVSDRGPLVSYEIEQRAFDTSFYLFDRRVDTRYTARVEVPVPQVELYGFRPVFNVEHSRQLSNVNRFDTETTGAGISIRSAF